MYAKSIESELQLLQCDTEQEGLFVGWRIQIHAKDSATPRRVEDRPADVGNDGGRDRLLAEL